MAVPLSYLSARLAAHPTLADDIAGVIGDLGRLPLALAQATAFMIDEGLSCQVYRGLFADRSRTLRRLVPEPGALPDDHRDTLDVTLSLSVEAVARHRPVGLAPRVLNLASMLDPNGIPMAVLTSDFACRWWSVGNAESVSVEDVQTALRSLHRFSLVVHDPGDHIRSVRVHALIQRATRERDATTPRHKMAMLAANALRAAWPQPESDPALSEALRANTLALRDIQPEFLWNDSNCHPILVLLGRSLGASGRAAAAAAYFEQLCADIARRFGATTQDALTCRFQLGTWKGEAGDFHGAVQVYELLIADCTQALGPDHQRTLTARLKFARARIADGDHLGIMSLIDIRSDCARALGEDHELTTTVYKEMLRFPGDKAGADLAATRMQGVVEAYQRQLGPDHPTTLAARLELAEKLGTSGDESGAVAILEDVVADHQRILGLDHPDTLTARTNLAIMAANDDNLATSVSTFETLVADGIRLLGEDHPQVLGISQLWAHLRGRATDAGVAVRELTQLWERYVRVMGPDHVKTLELHYFLAFWKGKAGDRDGALTAFDALLADYVRVFGEDHAQTRTMRANIRRQIGDLR